MLNVVFICGSLEAGHDGVGDYTRKLACRIVKAGHKAAIIALNDRFLSETHEGLQHEDDVNIATLRIHAKVADAERYRNVKQWITKKEANWISLQFVPYSFHVKGLPYAFFKNLSVLKSGDLKLHVLFHELWLDKPERLAQRVVATLQKLIISMGIRSIKPESIDVTIPYNQQRLKSVDINANVLGLFGNITKADHLLNSEPIVPDERKYKILYFGGPPRHTYFDQVINGLIHFCEQHANEVEVEVVSGNSKEKDLFVKALTDKLSSFGTTINDHGFLASESLSILLSTCSVGVVRSEPYFIGKSGSAIAMLEHGLPVWLPKWDGNGTVDYGFRRDLIYADLEKAAQHKSKPAYKSLLPEVSQQFISTLTNN